MNDNPRKGSRYAKVFPEPVSAMPIRSLPFKAIGHPCDWMAVGSTKPNLVITSRQYAIKQKEMLSKSSRALPCAPCLPAPPLRPPSYPDLPRPRPLSNPLPLALPPRLKSNPRPAPPRSSFPPVWKEENPE
nr:hypothetical protein Iba_chr03aCG11170 [Ipomoea batatas]